MITPMVSATSTRLPAKNRNPAFISLKNFALATPEQRAAFESGPYRRQVAGFADAGHVAHVQDPLPYASAVSDFARSAGGDLSGSGTGQVPASGW
jgi:hypothetical protein